MKILSVTNLIWNNAAKTSFNATVKFEELPFEEIVYTANANDAEDHGRLLWDKANSGDYGSIADYVAPSSPTPEEKREAMPYLTARQLRLGLLSLGKLADVPTAISALPSPEREQAEIEWQYASEFRRLHPLIVQLIPILGLTDEQIDPVWMEYSAK